MTKEQLLALIASGVSSELAFKGADIANEELAREIVAMANFNGGRILLGVAKNGEIKGISDQEIEEWVKSVVRQNVRPMLFPTFTRVEIGAAEFVLVLTLPKGPQKPYVLFLKPGDEKLDSRVPQRLIAAGTFAREAHIPYPDSLPVNGSSLEHLDRKKLVFYFHNILKEPELTHTRAEWEKKLKSAGLMIDETLNPRCTVAALLLFASKPWDFFHGRLSLSVVAGKNKEGLGRGGGFLNGRLHTYITAPFLGNPIICGSYSKPQNDGQIEECLSLIAPFIKKNNQRQYPEIALRELLINAFVHRDWLINFETKVDVYTDRIEVTSPGTMAAEMTPAKMLSGQRQCKNPTIMKILREYHYASYCGKGISGVVVPELARYGNQPKFDEMSEACFRVILPCQ